MTNSFLQVLIVLSIGIAAIVVLTARYHIHAFFALFIACFIVGLGVQMPGEMIIVSVKDGFGNIMKSLGFIIVLGTTLGVLLEYTGSTKVMAAFILRKVGERHAAFAMSITGFIVGLPIFCDSGYIVLSGLTNPIAKRTGISVVIMSVSLATGLYSVHCLIPPHPGAAAAAGTIGVDVGKLMLAGILVAIPAMIIGHLWARYAGKKIKTVSHEAIATIETGKDQPSVIKSFLPVAVPIILIAVKSFLVIEKDIADRWLSLFNFLGDPVIALSVGVMLAFNCKRNWKKEALGKLLSEGAEKAGGILIIIGAGGAFGAVLAATNIGGHFSTAASLRNMGILFPFLLTFMLKTAQGSSTVAIITAASVVQPLLHALGLETDNGRLLCVLSMGAGSMMISHANDAYFWVIAKFSGLDMKTMLRVYSLATIFMGLITFLMVYLLSFILIP